MKDMMRYGIALAGLMGVLIGIGGMVAGAVQPPLRFSQTNRCLVGGRYVDCPSAEAPPDLQPRGYIYQWRVVDISHKRNGALVVDGIETPVACIFVVRYFHPNYPEHAAPSISSFPRPQGGCR